MRRSFHSARLRWAIGRELGIDPKSVTGYMMGDKQDDRFTRMGSDAFHDVASGAMTEAFACGTAAVITPVGHVLGDDVDFVVNNNEAAKVVLPASLLLICNPSY